MKNRIYLIQATLAVLCGGLWCNTLSSPADITALLGQTVHLACAYTTNSLLTWSQIQTNGTKLSIFASSGGLLTNSSKPGKFDISGTYNLIINNVGFDDAGTYECTVWSASNTPQLANLVVIDPDSLFLSLTPSGVANVNNSLSVNCWIKYSAPSVNNINKPISAAQNPMLNISLNGISKLSTITTYSPVIGQYVASAKMNYTINSGDNGKVLQCSAVSLSYNSTVTRGLVVNSAPSEVMISPAWDSGTFYINNTFNCSTNAFPLATVAWTPITSGLTTPSPVNGGQAKGYALLNITDGTISNQTWTCTASNVYGSTNKTISINVATPNTGANTQSVDAVALGVGIGIGVGVPVVIALIVLIVCLVRRNRSQKDNANKPNSNSAAAAAGSVGAGQMASQFQAPPAYAVVSTNPRGARSNGSLYSAQGPLSPAASTHGFGDLGVPGANPSLNGSFVSHHSASSNVGRTAVAAPASSQNSDAGSTYRYVPPSAVNSSHPSLTVPPRLNASVQRPNISPDSSQDGISLGEDNLAVNTRQMDEYDSAV